MFYSRPQFEDVQRMPIKGWGQVRADSYCLDLNNAVAFASLLGCNSLYYAFDNQNWPYYIMHATWLFDIYSWYLCLIEFDKIQQNSTLIQYQGPLVQVTTILGGVMTSMGVPLIISICVYKSRSISVLFYHACEQLSSIIHS